MEGRKEGRKEWKSSHRLNHNLGLMAPMWQHWAAQWVPQVTESICISIKDYRSFLLQETDETGASDGVSHLTPMTTQLKRLCGESVMIAAYLQTSGSGGAVRSAPRSLGSQLSTLIQTHTRCCGATSTSPLITGVSAPLSTAACWSGCVCFFFSPGLYVLFIVYSTRLSI